MTNGILPASSPVFDLLEALSKHFPDIQGCYARYTGGVHWEPILAAIKSPTIPAGMVARDAHAMQFQALLDGVPADWRKHGYKSEAEEIADMAEVGRALMEALPEGYSYMNCPSEIVSDLMNERDEALAAAPKQAEQQGVERARQIADGMRQASEKLEGSTRYDAETRAIWEANRQDAEEIVELLSAALNAPTNEVEKGEATPC